MDFLRTKQSGVSADFTGTLATATDVFNLDELSRYGLATPISALAYDPVQSLLAVGTKQDGDTPGAVHIFGQKRVHVEFPLNHKASIRTLKLCDSRLIALDSRNDLTIFDLSTPSAPGFSYSPPGTVTVIETDPSLDWCFIGLQSGEVIIYDLDRECLAPMRVPNCFRTRSTRARASPVVSLQLHPKDVGRLLIGYNEGAVIYSLKSETPGHFLEFAIPPGAPGADSDLVAIRSERRPKLVQAVWHPTGTFVACTYEDSVVAVFNVRDGQVVEARTLDDTHVHIPGSKLPSAGFAGDEGTILVRQQIYKLAWCSSSNPDDTQLLIAGGGDVTLPVKGMTLLELGPSPNMLISSAVDAADHFAKPRKQRILPVMGESDVVDFCLLPRQSLHYGGTHDAVAVIALLANGEITTLKWPSGAPVSPADLLPPSLILSHPKPTKVEVKAFNRTRWLGMEPARNNIGEVLVGGIEHQKPLKRFENRTLAQTLHPNGTVRIWDVGHGDDIENQHVLELDVGRVLQRATDLQVSAVAMSSSTGETVVGMESGEVVVYRWGRNKAYGRSPSEENLSNNAANSVVEVEDGLVNVQMRTDPDLKEGLLPYCMLNKNCGSVVALQMSDVGFVAAAYDSGHICVVDLRGPTVIFHEQLASIATSKSSKRLSVHKNRSDSNATSDIATVLEFSILALEDQDFSSLNLFIGTTTGRILTFQLFPQGPTYTVTPLISTSLTPSSPILSLHPLTSSGRPAIASAALMSSLATAPKIPGVIVATTKDTCRIFKPPAAKGAHRSFEPPILSAGITDLEGYGSCLVTLTPSHTLRAYSLPGLKDLDVSLPLPGNPTDARILPSGYVFLPETCTLLQLFGTGQKLSTQPHDTLYNPQLPPPPRPTISGLQWLAGTQYISIPDLNLLIGGPDRPISRKQKQQEQEARLAEKQAAREHRRQESMGVEGAGGKKGEEGVFGNMMKNLSERTEQLSFASDSLDRLGESSASFADDVGKFVKKKQRDVLWGGLKSKFF